MGELEQKKKVPKLLSPVNCFEGGIRVIDAGADEVYCGVTIPSVKDFVLYRGQGCEIPTYEDLAKLVKYAHNHQVKVVVTVNQPFMTGIIEKAIRNHIKNCLDKGVDALIIGDMGILMIVKDMNVDTELYASTYMVSMNYEAVNFLGELGFQRVVLDRQLTMDEISEIVKHSNVEIEVFIHGGGCSNTNGNCYLYHFRFPALARAVLATEGIIKTPCSQPYEVYELNNPTNNVEQVPIMDAFEFCSMCKLPELMKTGVTGFKIEGRGEDIAYQETTTKIYRELIDVLSKGDNDAFQKKLEFLKDGGFNPRTNALPNLREVYCTQKRCYYSPLFHPTYKVPLSWQAWTKSQFKVL